MVPLPAVLPVSHFELCSDVLYKPGLLNAVLDCLSSALVSMVTLGMDYN